MIKERFRIPTAVEVREYALSLGYPINGERFVNYYEQKGWMIGKSPMKSWKAAVRLWKMNASENEMFKPTPKESDEARKERLLKLKRCVYCATGKLEFDADRGQWRCRNCSIDHTQLISGHI